MTSTSTNFDGGDSEVLRCLVACEMLAAGVAMQDC